MLDPNAPPIERYRRLVQWIEQHLDAPISIPTIERVSCYSYRHINRLFRALHRESIGQYVKRLRLERAAQYLKYAATPITQIAVQAGFEEVAAFSKAFKKRFGVAPTRFRTQKGLPALSTAQAPPTATEALPYELVELPAFEQLYVEHRGDYYDLEALEHTWDTLVAYTHELGLWMPQQHYLIELFDDEDISEAAHCRTHLSVELPPAWRRPPSPPFYTKQHLPQRYAKFNYHGNLDDMPFFYEQIYRQWLHHMPLEFADRPVMEWYRPPFETTAAIRPVEIYIAVQ